MKKKWQKYEEDLKRHSGCLNPSLAFGLFLIALLLYAIL
jgi:hypothetical protein